MRRRSMTFRAIRGRRRREEGFALFLAILVLLIMTVAGISLMFTTSVENTLSANETKVSKTFYAADSGLEYGAAKLETDVNYVGGTMPVGLSSHYPGSSGTDIQITVSKPIQIGYTIHPGDQVQSQGGSYGTTQIVENMYLLNSTATSTSIQSSKLLTADIGVYPQQLQLPL